MPVDRIEVVVIGNVGIDTNVYLYNEDVDFSVEANFSQNLDYIGQAGGYASRGYAALGRSTAIIGHLGADFEGEFIRSVFGKDDIDTRGMFTDPSGTSRSVNIMYRDGRRKNFYDGRGHMELHPPLELCRELLAGARLAHFNIPNWARELLPIARNCGAAIAVDLQDVRSLDDPYRRDFIEAADYLFFSAANHGDPRPLVEELLRRNARQIVLSGMGAQGCMLGSSETGIRHYPIPALDLPVIDTNGAGDSLAVGFLTARVLEGIPLEDSVLRGQIAARHCCAQKASTDHLITAQLLQKYYNETQGA
jgi:sugar/nucleoside kinase (ribokinase family)